MPGRGRPRNTYQGGDPAEPVINRDPRDIEEIERRQQQIQELELQQDKHNEETESNSVIWDVGFDEEENPFGRRLPPQAAHRIAWDHVKQKRRQQGKSRVETWDKMKKLLCAKFIPINYRQDAFFEYHSLMKNNSSIEQFIADFDRLRMRCEADEDEEQKYTDEVWCEVISMDACHLLLERPLQYDRRTKHDGFRNTYSFKKDGIHIVLAPLDSCDSSTSTMLLSKSEFLDYYKATDPKILFALVVTEQNTIISLPLMREIQHCIDFLRDASIPNKPAYRMNPKEHEELHRQVTELLEKGLIRESMSPCAVLGLLVPKHGGAYRMCIDCRVVNKIIIQYRFPILRFEDLLDQLHGAKFCSKIDLRSGYHQIRLRPEEEWKTAFKMRDGLYEWMLMSFGLSNAPSTFMSLMNHIFCEFIGRFVVVYFDDSLIFSTNIQQHLQHFRDVFTVLKDEKLFANHGKCHFLTTKVAFLIYLILCDGILMDKTKVHAITSWPPSKMLHDVRSFHGLASFYRRFIRNFSTIVAPITKCLKGSSFVWTDEAQQAFDDLKIHVNSAPVLALPNFHEVFQFEFDALGLGIDGVCHLAKSHYTNAGLYSSLSVPNGPWADVSIDFVLGLPHTLVGDNPKQWDFVLPQAEFAYNRSNHGSTCKSPFFIFYGRNPFTPLDLTPCPATAHFNAEEESRAKQIQDLHMQVKENQEKDKIRSKPNKKWEACQSQEKFKVVAVDKGRKTKENAKRMVKNAYT
nr:RNA-directed DNA polymerase [Tanacetum cinerariifolium]